MMWTFENSFLSDIHHLEIKNIYRYIHFKTKMHKKETIYLSREWHTALQFALLWNFLNLFSVLLDLRSISPKDSVYKHFSNFIRSVIVVYFISKYIKSNKFICALLSSKKIWHRSPSREYICLLYVGRWNEVHDTAFIQNELRVYFSSNNNGKKLTNIFGNTLAPQTYKRKNYEWIIWHRERFSIRH